MENELSRLVDALPGLVWTALPDGQIDYLNQRWCEYTGLSVDQACGSGWQTAVHPEDLPGLFESWRSILASGEPTEVEARLRRSDGEYRWFRVCGFPLRDRDGHIFRWYVLQTDVDDRKRAEALLAGEKRLLEMVAAGVSLSATLTSLCLLVEELCPECASCSILLLDPETKRLWHRASPSVPREYTESIDGFEIGPDISSCGTAAYLGKQIIASDIATDAKWSEFRALALANGLRACWSTPIFSQQNQVLGTFAVFSSKPSHPTAELQQVIEHITHLASIAIERERSQISLTRALAELTKSESRLRTIIDAIPGFVWSAAPDGSVEFLNQRWCDYTGINLQDASGAGWLPAIHPDDADRLLTYWQALLESGEQGEIEARLRRFDGEYRWFLLRACPLRDKSGKIVKWFGTNTDIDDRKRAEEELQCSEAFIAEGQRLSLSGSFLWRLDTDEIRFSEQLYRTFEFDRHTPVTLERIASRVHPEDIPLLTDKIEAARSGNDGDLSYEIRLRMPNGSVKYLRTIAHGTRDRNGRRLIVGANQDVTDRRLSEEALGKVRSELANMTRVTSLGALTASITHEINQPLSGIVTNASTCLRMLSADPPNVDGARETARRSIRDGNRASEVITRLRALFSKKDTTVEQVDLSEAAREVIALSLNDLNKDRVIVHAELADDLPHVLGDRIQLQQVILNLLRNASDAMSAIDDRPRRLLIRTELEEGDSVRLTVQDTGVGIDPKNLDALFNAFYTTKSAGMGIGLSISRSIIESHHGRLWAAPNDGPGATFSFSIPRISEGVTDTDYPGVILTPAVTNAAEVMRKS